MTYVKGWRGQDMVEMENWPWLGVSCWATVQWYCYEKIREVQVLAPDLRIMRYD